MFVHVSALSDLTLFMRAWLGCERRRKFIPWIQTITYVDVINNSAFEYAQYENCVRLLTHDANISWNSYSVAIRAIQMSWRFDCIELRSVHVNAQKWAAGCPSAFMEIQLKNCIARTLAHGPLLLQWCLNH